MFLVAFQNRAGRVISLTRTVLAAVFLIAIRVDPSQPHQLPIAAYLLLISYVLWALVLQVLVWRKWWIDNRTAAFAHIVDLSVFGTLVFFTDGYTSPFYTFSVFLLLSSAIRWRWIETSITAFVVLSLYIIAGTAAIYIGDVGFDTQRVLVRSVYLFVIAVLVIWFGVSQQNPKTSIVVNATNKLVGDDAQLVSTILTLVNDVINAKEVVFVWWLKEEPWYNISQLVDGASQNVRVGPSDFKPVSDRYSLLRPALFHNVRQLWMVKCDLGTFQTSENLEISLDGALVKRFGLKEGLFVPTQSNEYQGELYAMGIEGLCNNDLDKGEFLSVQVSQLLEQHSIKIHSQGAAVARTKSLLNRDLHDGVVQSLAGASFRLEALKVKIRSGQDPIDEIVSIQNDFLLEQGKIRQFIEGQSVNHHNVETAEQVDAHQLLREICEDLERHWHMNCEAVVDGSHAIISLSLAHELRQMLREAGSNAARHGKASSLKAHAILDDRAITLVITDDGTGFAQTGSFDEAAMQKLGITPRSVYERVKELGGLIHIDTSSNGSELHIQIPRVAGR